MNSLTWANIGVDHTRYIIFKEQEQNLEMSFVMTDY